MTTPDQTAIDAAVQAAIAERDNERRRLAVLIVAFDEIAALLEEPQSRLTLARIAMGGAADIARQAAAIARTEPKATTPKAADDDEQLAAARANAAARRASLFSPKWDPEAGL